MMKNPFRVLIITCWILLILCCIAKLFGANWFIAHTDNQTFISFCDYVVATPFLNFLVRFVVNTISSSIYFMAVFQQKKPTLNGLKWFIPLVIYTTFKSIFYSNQTLFFILDFVMTIILPLIIDYKRWLMIIIGVALVFAFQFLSMLLKMNQYAMFDENLVVGLILSIDYYIMLVLYWLYSVHFKKLNKEEN